MAVFNWGGASAAKDTAKEAPKTVGDYILGGLTIVGGVLGGIFGNQQQGLPTNNPNNPYGGSGTPKDNTGLYAIGSVLVVLALVAVYFVSKTNKE